MKWGIALVAIGSAVSVASAGTTFGNEGLFLGQLQHYSFNSFSDVTAGSAADLIYSLNGYEYSIGTPEGSESGLLNGDGIVSTQNANDSIVINFTSDNVMAIGMNVWGTDISYNQIPANITAILSDGTSVTFSSDSVNRFGGYVSDMIITSLIISAVDSNGNVPVWPTFDNLYVGTVVPLPAGAWAGIGMLGLLGGIRTIRRR